MPSRPTDLQASSSTHSLAVASQVKLALDDGVNVGLGVDGSASNDAGSLLHEARLACFLQRAKGDVSGAVLRAAILV